jgi:hypothetical protein
MAKWISGEGEKGHVFLEDVANDCIASHGYISIGITSTKPAKFSLFVFLQMSISMGR